MWLQRSCSELPVKLVSCLDIRKFALDIGYSAFGTYIGAFYD